jgi:hypothetical protein
VLYPSRDFHHEQEWFQQKAVRREVLLYVSVNGPSQWSEIYTHFEQRHNGASITHALRYLASVKFITIAIGGLTAITASGVEQLQSLE